MMMLKMKNIGREGGRIIKLLKDFEILRDRKSYVLWKELFCWKMRIDSYERKFRNFVIILEF